MLAYNTLFLGIDILQNYAFNKRCYMYGSIL